MNRRTTAGLILAIGLLAGRGRAVAAESAVAPAAAPLFRVFLTDGTTLVSYGEFARIGDRVVFSMPTAASVDSPALHLVTLGSSRVDWERTNQYAESVRRSRYFDTQAETDYAELAGTMAEVLNKVGATSDPAARLTIVERARRVMAEWPTSHFGYREAEVLKMVGMLDEAIVSLRAATGARRFALALVATTEPARFVPLLAPPTPQEAIEQMLTAAKATESSFERTSLLTVALSVVTRDAALLPAPWAATTAAAVRSSLVRELQIDRSYQALTTQTMATASMRARAADVRGIERLLVSVHQRDAAMGAARPESLTALVAAVESQLDAARRLRLARDQWAIASVALRAYETSIGPVTARLFWIKRSLEDIKALSGSGSSELARTAKLAGQALSTASAIVPPPTLVNAHALIVSAAQLAARAADIRKDAAVTGNMDRAWDASSAAAGALMLAARAKAELQVGLRPPQLPE
jgi:hypothetical protein